MIKLRPGQREVAAYRGGYMAVPAVPGAGKTTVLAHLAADLIEEGLNKPGKILIVTVMNSAVSNFRRKIGDFLEERGLSRTAGYGVKTLHSLAMSILKEKPEFLMINQNFQVIDESNQYQLLNYLSKEWMFNNRELWKKHIKIAEGGGWYQRALEGWEKKIPEVFRDALKYVKAACLTIEEVEELRRRLDRSSYLDWVLEIYQAYTKELNRNGMLDFDDLIVQALRLLKGDAGVLERLQNRWTFYFEDEAQDSNPLQEEILKRLSAQSGNLVRVGDSNQAIMGTFTAAEPEIFRRFCSCEDVQKESIRYSSRSNVQVIDLANHLVDWTREHHPQEECRTALEDQHILPVDEDDPFPNPVTDKYTIVVGSFKTQEEEIKRVAALAGKHVRRNPNGTTAVLVPTRYVQEDMKEEFKRLGVPFEEVGRLTGRQTGTIKRVELALEYLAQPHDVGLLIPLLENMIMVEIGISARDSLSALFEKFTPEQLIYPVGGKLPWLDMPDEFADAESYTAFINSLKAVKRWLDASVRIPPDELVLFLAEDMGLESDQLDIAHSLALLVRQKMHETPGCLLYDIAMDLKSLEGFLRRFLSMVNDQKGYEPEKGVVSLITAHKAKGLEWDTVYLTGVTPIDYPSTVNDKFRSEFWFLKEDLNNPVSLIKAELKKLRGGSVGDPFFQSKIDDISERLRLLYVAITRAKKNLLITYHKKNRFGKKAGPSEALKALVTFIEKERAKYDSSKT